MALASRFDTAAVACGDAEVIESGGSLRLPASVSTEYLAGDGSLSLGSEAAARTGCKPSKSELEAYIERHKLQAFMTDVLLFVAQNLPLDPYDFLINHIEALVARFRASARQAADCLAAPGDEGPTQSRPATAPSGGLAAQQDRVIQRVAAALQRPELARASASKLWDQFASASEEGFTGDDFRALCGHLQATWGLGPSDSQAMLDVLCRWRFRTNAAYGTRGLPLWPLNRKDFVTVFPSLLRCVRDRYVPIGGMIHRSLFVRQAGDELSDRYDLGPSLGRGAYGEVVLVTLKASQERRVCKRIIREQQRVPSEEIGGEVELLKKMDHPNIVRVFEFFETEHFLDIIMEPVFGGTLAQLICKMFFDGNGIWLGARPAELTEAWAATLTSQLLSALAYAHDVAGILHKDLKGDNVLLVGKPGLPLAEVLAEPAHAMLTDFGLAELFGDSLPTPLDREEPFASPVAASMKRSIRVGGTPPFMSPEMFRGSFAEKSDIWSLGVLFFQLMTGQLPYQGQNIMMLVHVVCSPRQHPRWEALSRFGWSGGARQLCQSLLCKEEDGRPTAAEALRDLWLIENRDVGHEVAPSPAQRDALQKMRLQSHLMRMTLHCVTSQLSLSQLDRLNMQFQHYDQGRDGRLSHVEARQLLVDAGITAPEDIELIFSSLDTDHDGFIEYSQFIAGCLDLASEGMRKHLRATFDIFNLDGTGELSLEELRQVLTQGPGAPAEPRPPDDKPKAPLRRSRSAHMRPLVPATLLPDGKTVEEVMHEMNTGRTGKVTYEEFEQYLLAEHARLRSSTLFDACGKDLPR
mmetsp:Transcript_129704/g.361242  ORF Transcript_129704/g.361242 Transcript_129704/m.361242 type:complete len:806 (+) Transcript_129704:67-2484(+)